jgi:glutamate transport system permease protein
VGAITGNLDSYLAGMRTTASLTLLAFVAALVIGVLVATARISPVAPLRWAGATYVELLRNTPLVVLMFLLFFGVPKLGYIFSAFTTAVAALALYTGAFVAETVRSGMNSVPAGQGEAARALGLSFRQSLTSVILPQALRSVVPPLGSLFIASVKNSAVAFTISARELTGQADLLITETAQTIPVLLGAAVAYLVLTLPAGLAVGVLERRVAIKR